MNTPYGAELRELRAAAKSLRSLWFPSFRPREHGKRWARLLAAFHVAAAIVDANKYGFYEQSVLDHWVDHAGYLLRRGT